MTHLNDLSKVYLENIASQETQEEGYKPIDKEKENKMYRRAGNLARTSLSSKGKKKEDAQNKSSKIVSAIARQKENERFAKMGDEKARDNYKEEVEQVDEADSLAAMAARREKRLAAQRKREGTTASGRDFGHDYSLSDKQQKARRDAEFKAGIGTKKEEVEVDEALDPVGKEDGDVNNDGKKDGTDKYLMNRRKAVGAAIAADRKKKAVKESYSDWRKDLSEVMTDNMDEKPIKEKKVNNKIKINPKLGEAVEEMGGTLIEHIEVDEMDFIVESVYDELIEEGFSEDDVEFGIETALNTLDEASDSYYDSAVKSSKDAAAKVKGKTPKKSLKDRIKSAAKKAIFGAGRAVGQAAKAKAAVQAAPEKAKSAMRAKIDKVKRIAKAGYKSGRGPVEKKSTYRGAGVGRKEKVTEAVYGGETEKKKDTRMTVTNADKAGNTLAYQRYKAGDKRYKAADHMGEGYGAPGHNPGSGEKSVARAKALMDKQGRKGAPGLDAMAAAKKEHEARRGVKKEEVEVDEAMSSYDRNRKRAAQRAAERNAARAAGKTGVVPGVGYVSPRKERETYVDSAGTTRHKSGAKMEQVEEEAAMSPQEVALQKKKAMIDKMIATKRMQGLKNAKKSEAPTKAMGEDADLDKMQKDADANRARAAKLKDRNVTRGSAALAARAVERDVKKAAKTGPQQYPNPGKGVKKIEKPKPTHTKTGGNKIEKPKPTHTKTGAMRVEGLSIDKQMEISKEYNRKSPEEKRAANAKVLGAIKKVKREKDTRTDAQKMTDATGPRPGSRYRGD